MMKNQAIKEAKGNHIWWERKATALFCLVALLPLLLLLIRNLNLSVPMAISGDSDIIELYTLRATHGTQLTGPYSRFGWHHPGPMLFYALAPIYILSGKMHGSLCLGALLINTLSFVGILLLALRAGGRRTAWWTAVAIVWFFLVLTRHLSLYWLASYWNPHISILPFVMAMLAIGIVGSGRIWFLIPAVIAGSFALQCHLAYGLPLVTTLIAAILAFVVTRKWSADRIEKKRWIKNSAIAYGIALCLAILLWLPPLVEQFGHSPGNFSRIAHFFYVSGPGHSLLESIDVVGHHLSAFVYGMHSQKADHIFSMYGQQLHLPIGFTWAQLISVIQLFLLISGTYIGFRRKNLLSVSFCFITLGIVAASLVSVIRIVGTVHIHHLRWISAMGLFNIVVIIYAHFPILTTFLQRRIKLSRMLEIVVLGFLLVIGTSINTISALQSPTIEQFASQNPPWNERPFFRSITRALDSRGIGQPHLKILYNPGWEQISGPVLEWAKIGREFSIDDRWFFIFGDEYSLKEDEEDGILLVVHKDTWIESGNISEMEQVAEHGDVRVLLGIPRHPVEGKLPINGLKSELYLRSGFYATEHHEKKAFRWSKGLSSRFSLPLTPGSTYYLRVVADPFVVPGERQRLSVELNGSVIGHADLYNRQMAEYSFTLPAPMVRSKNTLIFRYAYAIAPSEISSSTDTRRLAVRFYLLEIEQAI